MITLDRFKNGVNLVVSIGVGKIISGIVQHDVPRNTIVEKTTVLAGQIVITAIVKELTEDFVNAKIDKAADWYKENIKDRLNEE